MVTRMKRLLTTLLLALLALPAYGATYYIDSSKTGGGRTGLSPADAWLCIADMLADSVGTSGSRLTSADTVYVASGSVDTCSYGASQTVYTDDAWEGAKFVSVSDTSNPTTSYSPATTNWQIDLEQNGAYSITFSGSTAFYGISINSGANIIVGSAGDEITFCQDCKLRVGPNGYVAPATQHRAIFRDTVFDAGNDSGASTTSVYRGGTTSGTVSEIYGGSFANITNRTGQLFGPTSAAYDSFVISGVDASGLQSGTELTSAFGGNWTVNNVLVPSGASLTPVGFTAQSKYLFTNVGDSDRPWYLLGWSKAGRWEATSGTYRVGGASIGGTAHSWLFTDDYSADTWPADSPWIYGSVSSTGSKTFSIAIANDTGNLTDRQAWIECQMPGTSGEAISTLIDDHAGPSATAANQATDSGSTWSAAKTYMQTLAATGTVNQAGQFRCRVMAANSGNFYVDPKVTVN